MGNSVDSMVRKLEYEKVDKNKALAFEEKLKQNFSMKWSERQICKKRSGLDVKNFDSFMEEFKKNNDLEEKSVKVLRDLKFVNKVEDKVKTFVFDCEGSLCYGMIAATKSSAGIIDFIISLYVIQYTVNNVLEMKE